MVKFQIASTQKATGGIRCFRKYPRTTSGNYVALALTDAPSAALCAVTLQGSVECLTAAPGAPTFGGEMATMELPVRTDQIAGSGSMFCAGGQRTPINCWDRAGKEKFASPGPITTSSFAVSPHFVCAQDIPDRLICWGDDDALYLPTEIVKVDAIAAGDDFVCALTPPNRTLRCWGQAPKATLKSAQRISAKFGTLCLRAANGASHCFGEVPGALGTPLESLAISRTDVCGLKRNGEAECLIQKLNPR